LKDEEHIWEAVNEGDSQYTIDELDTVTSMTLSKDGKYLLTNVSLKKPHLDLWDLNRKERVN